MTIPAIIYQTSESLDVPPHLRRLQQSLREHNPQFEFRLSDAAERTQHVLKHFPEWGDVYQALPFGVAKADIWRVMAVYSSGGFYADLDMEGFRSLERFRHYGLAIFSIEAQVMPARQRELGYAQPYQLATCMFAAPPRHPFLKAFLDQMLETLCRTPIRSLEEVEDATGPRALTRLFYKLRPVDVGVLEQVFWVPPGLYVGKPLLSANVYCRHHFDGSWKPKKEKPTLKRQLIERDRLPNPFPPSPWHDFGWGRPNS